MAPAITHFLVGATIVLLVVAFLALRYDVDRTWAVWLVIAGGVWGLVPDFHNVTSTYHAPFRALHDSPRADLFGLHYTLDRDVVRAHDEATILVSIAAVVVATTVFWLAGEVRTSDWHPRTVAERVVVSAVGAVAAAAVAGVVVAFVLLQLERLGGLAALVDVGRLPVDRPLLIAVSTAYTAVIVAILETVVPPRHARPHRPASLVILVGWAVVVAVAVLLWLANWRGVSLSIPVLGWEALLLLLLYGGLVAILYPFVRGGFVSPEPTATDG